MERAVDNREWELVKELLDRGEGMDVRFEHTNKTIAHMAVEDDRLDVLQKCGDLIDVVDDEGQSPLWMALWWNYSRIAHWLLDQGCKIGNDMLHSLGRWNSEDDDSLLARLLNTGANALVSDPYGRHPIFYAHSTHQIDVLVARGAQVDVKDEDGIYPMTLMIGFRSERCVLGILKHAPCKEHIEQALAEANDKGLVALAACLKIALGY